MSKTGTMGEAALAPAHTKRLVGILFTIQLVSMGAMEMSGPFWPLYLRAISSSDLVFNLAGILVYVGPMLGIVLTSAFWGRVGDRHGHRLMMIRALLGLALTQLALAYASDVASILVLRFLQGACAGYIAPAQAYGIGIETAQRRARLLAFLQVSTNVGSLAGAVAGGVILDHADFFAINTVAALMCGLCALAVWLLLPERAPLRRPASAGAPAPAPGRGGAAAPWRAPAVLWLLGVSSLLLVSRSITQTPFSLYVKTTFGVQNWVTGLCYGLLALGFVVSASPWARYFEKKTLDQVFGKLQYIVAACAVLMLAAALATHIAVFVAVYFAWGVLLGATTPVLVSQLSHQAGNGEQGYILGLAQSTMQCGSVCGIALGVAVSAGLGLHYVYVAVALCYAIAAAVISLANRKRLAPLARHDPA